MVVESVNNKNKNNNKRPNKGNDNKIVSAPDRGPSVRYHATRNIELENPQVSKQILHVSYFGGNYSTLMGAFIKASQSQSVQLLDEYVDKLLSTHLKLVVSECERLELLKKKYESKGWTFAAEVTPQVVEIKIYRNCINDFADLLLAIDKLITLLNHIEKTSEMKTPELFAMVSYWVKLPSQLNKKLFGLIKRLQDKFKFNARTKTNTSVSPDDFAKINGMLKAYHTEQINVLTQNKMKEKTKVKPVLTSVGQSTSVPKSTNSKTAPKEEPQEKISAIRKW
jgi:hypothetical protein